jgi:hypothetical protein
MNAIYVVNYNDILSNNSRLSFIDAAKRWNAEYVEITESSGLNLAKGMKATAIKVKAFGLTRAARILIIDADVIIRSDCPSLFEVVPESMLGAALGAPTYHPYSGPELVEVKKFYNKSQKYLDLPEWDSSKYINTGVMLASHKYHEELFDAVFELEDIIKAKWYEQIPFCFALTKYNHEVYILNDTFNYRPIPLSQIPTKMNHYIVHLAGVRESNLEKRQILDGIQWQI